MRFNEIEWMVGKIWKVDLPDSEVCTEKTYALILASYYRNVATNDKRTKMLPNFLRYISEKCDVSKTRVVNNNNSRILNVFFYFSQNTTLRKWTSSGESGRNERCSDNARWKRDARPGGKAPWNLELRLLPRLNSNPISGLRLQLGGKALRRGRQRYFFFFLFACLTLLFYREMPPSHVLASCPVWS